MINHLNKIHRDLTDDDIKSIWKEGIFIFDTNVLLGLYRLQEDTRNDFISVLQNPNFKSRLWIGYQVVLEFHNNRLSTIGEQKSMFSEVIKLTDEQINSICELNSTYLKKINQLNLKQRHSTIDPSEYITEDKLNKTIKRFKRFKKHLKGLESQHIDVNNRDDIKKLIFEIFDNKIGHPLADDEILKINQDGEKRYKDEIPPGYKDSSKTGQYIVKNQQYLRKFGDLYFWNEILKFTKDNKLKYVTLVTGDIKEDWWEEKRGRKLGPRKELLNEIYNVCENLERFHIYNTSSFLKFAQQELDSKIKDTSINETRSLIDGYHKRNRDNVILRKTISEIEYIDEIIPKLLFEIDQIDNRKREITIYKSKLYRYSSSDNEVESKINELEMTERELDDQKQNLLNELKSHEMHKRDLSTRVGFIKSKYKL